jgi:probable HAF family extracellular repeat protein
MSIASRRFSVLLAAAIVAGLLASTVAAATEYTITDLGSLGGNDGFATDINAAGQVVGVDRRSDGRYHAFSWQAGAGMTDLGTLGGFDPNGPPSLDSTARRLNASGQVVGYSYGSDGNIRGCLWDAGSGMRDVGTLGGTSSCANGINDSSQVVGWTYTASGAQHAFLWQKDTGMTDLGGGMINGTGINNAGQVTGATITSGGATHAFRWQSGSGMEDLGSLGGWSIGYDINSVGDVVGISTDAGNTYQHAVIWDASGFTDLTAGLPEPCSAIAYGLNDIGQVVVRAFQIGTLNSQKYYIWSRSTGLEDLNTMLAPAYSDWQVTGVQNISNTGQVVGNAIHNGQTHAIVLTPVPEPASLALLGVGAAALLMCRRRGA